MIKIEGFDFSGSWADLGCGTGTFTLALASLFKENGIIYAIDKNKSVLNNIPDRYEDVLFKKYQADFMTDQLPFDNVSGIMMANSLHYVKDKHRFIKKLKKHLLKAGCFLIVEYESTLSNPWVPILSAILV